MKLFLILIMGWAGQSWAFRCDSSTDLNDASAREGCISRILYHWISENEKKIITRYQAEKLKSPDRSGHDSVWNDSPIKLYLSNLRLYREILGYMDSIQNMRIVNNSPIAMSCTLPRTN